MRLEKDKEILITGIAGFIGFHLAKKLSKSYKIVGIDNLNKYYDVELKISRLNKLGIFLEENKFEYNSSSMNVKFYKADITDSSMLEAILSSRNISVVIHLAAQAGVRYSLVNPTTYIENNVVGFFSLLEAMKKTKANKLIYASSSSIYGSSTKDVFHESDKSDHQVSLYAATKKTNEIFAKTYSELYNIKAVGLRFFTVYGSYGRPDMAYFKFTKHLNENKQIDLYNYGNQKRDYTHIDDITNGIGLILNNLKLDRDTEDIYNIGSGNPITLMRLIQLIENNFNKKFKLNKVTHQKGDVKSTNASIEKMNRDFNFSVEKEFESGIKEFIDWYKEYYKVK